MLLHLQPPRAALKSFIYPLKYFIERCFPAIPAIDGVTMHDSSSAPVSTLWDGFLFGVPKKRTTKIKKRMRNRAKNLKPLTNLETCRDCGNTKMMYHLCPYCHPFIRWITAKDYAVQRHQTTDRKMASKTPDDVNRERENAKKKK